MKNGKSKTTSVQDYMNNIKKKEVLLIGVQECRNKNFA